eukprot:gene704-383_t
MFFFVDTDLLSLVSLSLLFFIIVISCFYFNFIFRLCIFWCSVVLIDLSVPVIIFLSNERKQLMRSLLLNKIARGFFSFLSTIIEVCVCLISGSSPDLTMELKEENEKLKKQLAIFQKKVNDEEQQRVKLEQKLAISNKTLEAREMEVLLLQRRLKDTGRDKGQSSKNASPGRDGGSCSKCEALQKQHYLLMEECKDLKNTVSKLSKLIDVLKRQKILLEAGVLLSIAEKDFDMFLDSFHCSTYSVFDQLIPVFSAFSLRHLCDVNLFAEVLLLSP